MNKYFVAFWNVENLFDVVDSPRRSEKLQRTLRGELSGWNAVVLDQKLQQLASIIKQLNNARGPDLLGVCEVENDHVLNELVARLDIPGRQYQVVHHDMSDNRGIDVAFIFDPQLFTANEIFSHEIIKRSATRDLFQVNFTSNASNGVNRLIVIGNHWPSRSGGQYESEPYRMIAGETLAYFHERIRAIHGTDVAVLAMGDFNDEPFNRSLMNYANAERLRAKVTLGRSAKLLNLMWESSGARTGTHYFNNQPNLLDQILISKGLITGNSGFSVDIASTRIEVFPEHVTPGRYPTPRRFGRGLSADLSGFSDHFPISVTVKES